MLGGIATGKSQIICGVFNTLELTKYQPFSVNFSYGISSRNLQKAAEVNFERRNNKLYPPSNKKSICYIVDLNLPKKEQFGGKTIIEILRQYMELEGWYSNDTLNYIIYVIISKYLYSKSLKNKVINLKDLLVNSFQFVCKLQMTWLKKLFIARF